MNTPLSTIQQEQDLLFNEKFPHLYQKLSPRPYSEATKSVKAFMHTRDLAIEEAVRESMNEVYLSREEAYQKGREAVRAEVVEKIEASMAHMYTNHQLILGGSDFNEGFNQALNEILALLTTSPSR